MFFTIDRSPQVQIYLLRAHQIFIPKHCLSIAFYTILAVYSTRYSPLIHLLLGLAKELVLIRELTKFL